MRAPNLVVRCYAEQLDGQWQAFCLDLSLAAQADSYDEAKAKLLSMIGEYVHDAVSGEDKEFAAELLSRKAPLRYWAKFYAYCAMYRLGVIRDGMKKFFCQPMPLEPVAYKHAA